MGIVRIIMGVFLVSAMIGYIHTFHRLRSRDFLSGIILENVTATKNLNGDGVLEYWKNNSVLCSYNVGKNEIIPSYDLTQTRPRLNPANIFDKLPVNSQVLASIAGGGAGGLTLVSLAGDLVKLNKTNKNIQQTIRLVAAFFMGASVGYFLGATIAEWTPPGPDSNYIQEVLEDPTFWVNVGKRYKKNMGSFITFSCRETNFKNSRDADAFFIFGIDLQRTGDDDTLKQDELMKGTQIMQLIAAQSPTSFDKYVHMEMGQGSSAISFFKIISFSILVVYVCLELFHWLQSKRKKPEEPVSTDITTSNID
jgi:hypothetical protein